MAEDDEDDYLLSKEALRQAAPSAKLVRVKDGVELLAYLRKREQEDGITAAVLLIDLNMPRVDGRTVLKQIKSDPRLRRLPCVVFTTSPAREDIERSYDCGGNSYILKPESFRGLVETMRGLCQYWFSTVQLPN